VEDQRDVTVTRAAKRRELREETLPHSVSDGSMSDGNDSSIVASSAWWVECSLQQFAILFEEATTKIGETRSIAKTNVTARNHAVRSTGLLLRKCV